MEAFVTIQQPGQIAARPAITDLVECFLTSQDVRPQSRQTYRRSLRQFFEWVTASGLDIGSMTRADLIEFKRYLLDRGLSPNTVASYMVTLRLFYSFLEVNGFYRDIAKKIKSPRKPAGHRKEHLTPDEGRRLLEVLAAQSPRNKAIGAVLLLCGLRTIEASRLLVGDLVQRSGVWVLQIQGKGRDAKDEAVEVNQYTREAIRDYLATRPKALTGSPMFVSESNNNRGGAMSPITISDVIKEGLRLIGLDSHVYTAHSLRHTFAVSMLKAGASIYDVQKLLRHRNISTTQIYLESIEAEEFLKKNLTGLINDLYKPTAA